MSSLLSLFLAATATSPSATFRLNQVGYAVDGPKLAVLRTPADSVRLLGPDGSVVWTGAPSAPRYWSNAEDTGRLVDFSAFRTPGRWRLSTGKDSSWPVNISSTPWNALLKGLVKGLWYNRCSYTIASPEGGLWTRPAGHPDTEVLVHSSAVGPRRQLNALVRAPGGWYDAGDYGKYLPSAAITTWSLLHLHQLSPATFDTLDIGVPAHRTPSDLLDEAIWGLRWMLSLQDPDDGGVYHRLTTARFPSDNTMPAGDRATRYLSPKSTAAALELAATAAKASRILRSWSPDLADSCLSAAVSAWRWARIHPTTYFDADSIRTHFTPALDAGPYSDGNVSDEFDWAASELLLATGQDSFALALDLPQRIAIRKSATRIDWGDVRSLGVLSLSLESGSRSTGATTPLGVAADSMLVRSATAIRNVRDRNGYHLPATTWKWSSNTIFANNGFVCWSAWRVSRDTSFHSAAVDMLDYLLGRNATGYSFVTGFGAQTPQAPHHRISIGDGVPAPVPGMLVGGPNPGQEDQCPGYPSTLAPESYVDDACSYASNEPAINQNAALILLSGALSLPRSDNGSSAIPHHLPPTALRARVQDGILRVRSPHVGSMELSVTSLEGRLLARVSSTDGDAELPLAHRGFLILRVRSGGKTWHQGVVSP